MLAQPSHPIQNQDLVTVSANVMTAMVVPPLPSPATKLPVKPQHCAKSASYKACIPTVLNWHKVALQVVPVGLEGENGNSVNTWA